MTLGSGIAIAAIWAATAAIVIAGDLTGGSLFIVMLGALLATIPVAEK